MISVERNFEYLDDEYLSVFIGYCESIQNLEKYIEQDYDLFFEDYINFEMGIDFGIDTYDEDFTIIECYEENTDKLEIILSSCLPPSIIENIRKNHPNELNEKYNCLIILADVKYEGEIKEVNNDNYGRFRFIDYILKDDLSKKYINEPRGMKIK